MPEYNLDSLISSFGLAVRLGVVYGGVEYVYTKLREERLLEPLDELWVPIRDNNYWNTLVRGLDIIYDYLSLVRA